MKTSRHGEVGAPARSAVLEGGWHMTHLPESAHDPDGDRHDRPTATATPAPASPSALVLSVTLCAALGAGSAVGAVVLLCDALSGVVGMPIKAVRYLSATAVLSAAIAAWVGHRRPARGGMRLAAVCGGLACVSVLVAACVPTAAVFSAALILAGVPAGLALSATRTAFRPTASGALLWYAAVLAGLAASAVVCALLPDDPDAALAVCAGAAATLHVPLAVAGGRSPSPPRRAGSEAREAAPLPAGSATGYAAVGFALAGTTVALLNLFLFRWTILGPGVPWRCAGALAAAALVPASLAPFARRRTGGRGPGRMPGVPVLLVVAATGPILAATAPGGRTAAAGLAVAACAGALSAIALDARIRDTAPKRLAGAPTSMFFAGAFAAVAWHWGLGRVLSTENATVSMAIPIGLSALAVAAGTATGHRRGTGRSHGRGIGPAAALFLAAVTVGAFATSGGGVAHAASVPTVEVTATTGLTAGQKITVTGRGFRPGLRAVAVGQCSQGYTGPGQCDLGAGATFVNVDSKGRLPTVTLTMVTSVHGVDCLTTQCVIGVGPLPGSNPKELVDTNTVNVRLGFVGGAVQGEAHTHVTSTGVAAVVGETPRRADTSPTLWALTVAFLALCLAGALMLQGRARSAPEDRD